VQQFLKEGHLRWDSLGEFLALAVSLRDLADKARNDKARLMAQALDRANSEFLENNKSPTRRLGGIDNRGSHFYLCLYWAQALAEQGEDAELQARFQPLAKALEEKEQQIVEELLAVQGKPADIGGYYHPDDAKADAALRPSQTLNDILAKL